MTNEVHDFYDVYAGSDDMRSRVYRFPGDREGFMRAKTYARNYNASLRATMGLSEADLETERPDFLARPHEYDLALKVETYREHSAAVRGADAIPVVGNDEPLPTDYPSEI